MDGDYFDVFKSGEKQATVFHRRRLWHENGSHRRGGHQTDGWEEAQNQASGLDLVMGFVDMLLELAGDLSARLFGCPGSGATRHWGWRENFIAIGTLEGDGCPRNVVGHDECGHLVSHLTAAMVGAIFHVPSDSRRRITTTS